MTPTDRDVLAALVAMHISDSFVPRDANLPALDSQYSGAAGQGIMSAWLAAIDAERAPTPPESPSVPVAGPDESAPSGRADSHSRAGSGRSLVERLRSWPNGEAIQALMQEAADALEATEVARRGMGVGFQLALAIAIRNEREACAKIAETYDTQLPPPAERWLCSAIAAALRARGETTGAVAPEKGST